jgi:cyclohexa-1,5-dienecarbonyl-CoA hydratase
MRGDFLRLEHTDGLVRLTLDRPPLNVLHIPLLHELDEALAAVGADAEARVLVVTGKGKAFCAGVDVADHTPERIGTTLELFHGAVRRLLALELPVIAAVNGAALGGGCELVLACDVVLARAGATLGQPEIRLGALPPVAAVLMPRLLGRQRALDLILSGEVFTADEAVGWGLVTRVLADEEFEASVAAYTEGLASLSRPVLRLAKRAIREGESGEPTEALEAAEKLYLDELMSLGDAREGLAAFMEKREPVWSDA